MQLYRRTITWRRYHRSSRLLQILLILGIWAVGEGVVRAASFSLPGSIVGLFLLLAGLLSGWLNLRDVRKGAQWFLAEMLLFFVPAVLALLDHPELLHLEGLEILAVILISTLIVMLVTSAVIELCYRWLLTRKGHADAVH